MAGDSVHAKRNRQITGIHHLRKVLIGVDRESGIGMDHIGGIDDRLAVFVKNMQLNAKG